MPLHKNGTFGWSKLTYVGEVKEARARRPTRASACWRPAISGWTTSRVEKVGDDVALTPEPVIGAEEKPVEPPGDAGADCGPLPRVRLPQRSLVGPLLRLRRGAGRPESRGRRAAGQAHHLLRGPQPVRRRHRRRGARHRRQEGPAHRPRLRRHGRGRRTGPATTTSRPTSTPTPRTRWSCTSRSATGRRATTGPGSITPPSSRRARAR